MVKLFRGDVISALQPDGQGGLKARPLIVFRDTKKDSDSIVVYCTTKNDGNDRKNILVLVASDLGKEMGLTEDTYIRQYNTGPISAKFILRRIGKCPSSIMHEIQRIADRKMTER
jgi:hypothetical protein